MFSSAQRLLSLRIKVSAMKNSSIKCITNATMIALLLCTARSLAPASVKSYQKELSGVTFTLDRGLMEIRICRADIIEVRYTSLQDFIQRTSLVVVNRWETPTRYGLTERSGRVVISTDRLIISVDKRTEAIEYADTNGTVVLAEAAPSGKTMNAATVAGIQTYCCSTTFLSPPDEALFGLGCHPEDSLAMNYKGRDQDLAIRYMTGAIPVLLSSRGYGLLWDNYSASKFYGAVENSTRFQYMSESGTMVDYYFFYGPDFDQVIARYRETTGQAPLVPKWALGLFQSQDRYKSQEEVLSVMNKYRSKNIPVDCIVQDWFYWEPNVIGSHVMDPTRYPNPKAMIDSLHTNNCHAMISIWPVFAKGTKDYDALQSSGGLIDVTWDNVMTHTFDSYYDAHSAKARDLYWRQLSDSLVRRYGWDAIWVDQCEPDNGSLLDARKQATFAIGRGIDYFNTYSLMHTTGLYEHWRKDIPGKRAFFLARQAFAGEQRNAATLWSSDITCTFHSFKDQVPQGINACASGIPYWTSDIGGYHFQWQSPDWSSQGNRELFTRWFQFGAFCPVFRIHGKGERALYSQNWDDATKAILLRYDNLRYRLMPYIYSLAWRVTHSAYTIMRALAFDFRNDAAVFDIKDQYMFGPAFLVNPVTDQQGSPGPAIAATRKVYLPRASSWVDFWTGKTFSGGQTIEAPAPIETMPLYVRAGSIVPMGPFLQYATQTTNDTLELRIYPGADGTFTLYEDENDTYDYERGSYATITFSWDDRRRELTISDRSGRFPGMLQERTFAVILVASGQGTGIEFSRHPAETLRYLGKQIVVKF